MGVYHREDTLSPGESGVGVRVGAVPSPSTQGKKNKRKSQEPKRLQSVVTGHEVKRRRLNSTGSEVGSSPVSGRGDSYSRTPSPQPSTSPEAGGKSLATEVPTDLRSPGHLAPKKRFKLDALRDLKQLREAESYSEAGMKTELKVKEETSERVNPFRPWSGDKAETAAEDLSHANVAPLLQRLPFLLPGLMSAEASHPLLAFHSRMGAAYGLLPYLTPEPIPVQEEPLSLVKEKKTANKEEHEELLVSEPKSLKRKNGGTVARTSVPGFNVETILSANKIADREKQRQNSLTPTSPTSSSSSSSTPSSHSPSNEERAKQRNYKNLTRERRVEANARERQRVHTITAAFDSLQAAIPVEEENAKLSKLSVIKIATAYIMALSRMAGHDYTEDQSAPSVSSVISHCQEVIHNEARVKKRS